MASAKSLLRGGDDSVAVYENIDISVDNLHTSYLYSLLKSTQKNEVIGTPRFFFFLHSYVTIHTNIV